MDFLILQNIRCFSRISRIPIKPLTLLIGENSTGKTTLLAMYRIAFDLSKLLVNVNFNEEPFILGSFNDIYPLRQLSNRNKWFQIGCDFNIEITDPNLNIPAKNIRVICKFVRSDVHPVIRKWSLISSPYEIHLLFKNRSRLEKVIFKGKYCSYTLTSKDIRYYFPYGEIFQLGYFIHYLMENKKIIDKNNLDLNTLVEKDFNNVQEILSIIYQRTSIRPFASTPIRTKPQISYDPLQDKRKPEGSHVPINLIRLIDSDSNINNELHQIIIDYGNKSGLYDDIRIRKLGDKREDPFQVEMIVSGEAVNIMYVGYGISQVLPIVFDAIEGVKNRTYLMQQPEVHLHPKAQAELGTLMVNMSQKYHKYFIIETHSDYLLDRIRLEIINSKINNKNVVINYLYREGNKINLKSISIDKNGNLHNVPKCYRKFFLEEEKNLLIGAK